LAHQTVLLIEPDPQTAEFVLLFLHSAGYAVSHSSSGKEGLIAAWRDPVDLIISELDLPDIDGCELIQKLRRDQRTQRTPIVILTHITNPATTGEAFNAGANRVIVKQPDAMELLEQFIETEVDAAVPATGGAEIGYLVAFIGVRGGAGTSSLSVNVAHFLGLEHGADQVVLLDLDLPLGSQKFITSASPGADIARLTSEEAPALLEADLKPELANPRGWAFTLIAGVDHPRVGDRITPAQVGPLLQSLRRQFIFTIIDLGRGPIHLARLIFGQANQLVLVFHPDEEGVERVRLLRDSLREEGVPANRICALSNRPFPTDSLTQRSVQERLGRLPVTAIPNMGDSVALANAMHVPLQLRFPDARGTAALSEFAAQLAERLRNPEPAG
jgi:Flp pilus assembly CpaE family ATPase